MKKLSAVLVAFMIVGGVAMLGTGLAHEHVDIPEHPHLLLLGLEFNAEGEPVGFRKCVDLAANQALPLNSQHHQVHFGPANEALFTKAGHVVIPAAPFPGVEWANCAEFEAIIAATPSPN